MGRHMNDLKCRVLQKAVYAKLYKGHKPNEWEPWQKPGEKRLDNGLICRNDIRYSETYPNSYFDLWRPDDSGERRPTIVYFHGGGFIFGDKSTGDPLRTIQRRNIHTRLHADRASCGTRPPAPSPEK